MIFSNLLPTPPAKIIAIFIYCILDVKNEHYINSSFSKNCMIFFEAVSLFRLEECFLQI
jgi:hypothetical protein